MTQTQLLKELAINDTMVVGAESVNGRVGFPDIFMIIFLDQDLEKMGLEIDASSPVRAVNLLAKFGGQDFLKFSAKEAQTDRLVLMGIPDFSRVLNDMNIIGDDGQLSQQALDRQSELGVELTCLMSSLHTKENWISAITRANPKILSIIGEMIVDPPVPENYSELINSSGIYFRNDYWTALCSHLPAHSEIVVRGVEKGLFAPQGRKTGHTSVDPTPMG